jgi:hypothetical protein
LPIGPVAARAGVSALRREFFLVEERQSQASSFAESITFGSEPTASMHGRTPGCVRGQEGGQACRNLSQMVGQVVIGRFRVLERIGSGGMGTVYRAFDERLQRQVAIKEIQVADKRRALREAQAAARLNHPSIVTLYEIGSQGDRALLVSELVDGGTLSELAGSGSLTDRGVAEIGMDLASALAHAHARSVVHRDVKPQNVVVREDGMGGRRAKLMDFGIARLEGAATLTATGEVVGTLSYMAPEQAEGETAGPAADVYSLALTLFECWAGEQPVAGETPAETARRIGLPVPSLGEYRPDLPHDLVACVDSCLVPDPSMRPQAAELRHRLEEATGSLDDERAVPAPAATPDRAIRWRPRVAHVAAVALWAAILLLMGGAAGYPGLAVVLAALTAPGLFVFDRLRWTCLLPLAPLLGAASAGPAFTAVASRPPRLAERAWMGALGWCWMLVGAALGLGPRLGLISRPPHGWAESAHDAASALLVPLIHVDALVGLCVFAIAAVTLGAILEARHVALAALGALLWAAALNAALSVVGNGGLSGRPVVLAAAGLAALATYAWPDGARSPLSPPPASRQRRIREGEPARVAP